MVKSTHTDYHDNAVLTVYDSKCFMFCLPAVWSDRSVAVNAGGGGRWRWFNERTVQLRALPLVPSPTGPHPAGGDRHHSGVCMCIHVCLVWSVFPTAFIVPNHLPVCQQLHTDSPAQLDSIWTWRIVNAVQGMSSLSLVPYIRPR